MILEGSDHRRSMANKCLVQRTLPLGPYFLRTLLFAGHGWGGTFLFETFFMGVVCGCSFVVVPNCIAINEVER